MRFKCLKSGSPIQEGATPMRVLADRLDKDAWDAREAGDDQVYDVMFRRSRAVSALAFALSEEPEEAIYEAAHALATPDDLVRRLSS
jgi:hypothetical protein